MGRIRKPLSVLPFSPAKENTMPSERHNTQAGEEQRGSSGDNMRQQEQESRDPDKSNARDRTGRKGGDNAKNL
jgi:hypothetical protein